MKFYTVIFNFYTVIFNGKFRLKNYLMTQRENYELYDEIAYMLPQERCVVER